MSRVSDPDSSLRPSSKEQLAPNPRMIVEAAEQRGIPWCYDRELRLIQLGRGVHRRWIRSMATSLESEIAVGLAQDKSFTKKILRGAGIPVPAGTVARSVGEALSAFTRLHPPLVLKPVDGHKGKGVSLGIRTEGELLRAFAAAASESGHVLIEEQFSGCDYRVLVVGGKVFAAAERRPAEVIGDGVHSIAELAALENLNPLRGNGRSKPLAVIELDEIARAFLARSGLTINTIPEAGSRVLLRANANLSQGGSARDVTDLLHPELRHLCERAARVIGLPLCGIDLIVRDITRPISSPNEGIIEINAGPGIRVHHYPSEGRARDAGAEIVRYLFPDGADGRIPVAWIDSPLTKNQIDRLSQGLGALGFSPGIASTQGIWVSGVRIATSSVSGAASLRLLFNDPLVDVAVCELPEVISPEDEDVFDCCDVAVVGRPAAALEQLRKRIRPGGCLLHLSDRGIGNDDIAAVIQALGNRLRRGEELRGRPGAGEDFGRAS